MEKLNLGDSAVFYLSQARKWAKFIAIISFVGIGMMVMIGVIMGLVLDTLTSAADNASLPFSGGAFMVLYILLAAVYFFPVYYLYRFSVDMGNALASGSEEVLTSAFQYLKNHYKFIGILMIVSIVIGILSVIGIVLATLFGLFNAHPQTNYF